MLSKKKAYLECVVLKLNFQISVYALVLFYIFFYFLFPLFLSPSVLFFVSLKSSIYFILFQESNKLSRLVFLIRKICIDFLTFFTSCIYVVIFLSFFSTLFSLSLFLLILWKRKYPKKKERERERESGERNGNPEGLPYANSSFSSTCKGMPKPIPFLDNHDPLSSSLFFSLLSSPLSLSSFYFFGDGCKRDGRERMREKEVDGDKTRIALAITLVAS